MMHTKDKCLQGATTLTIKNSRYTSRHMTWNSKPVYTMLNHRSSVWTSLWWTLTCPLYPTVNMSGNLEPWLANFLLNI